MAGIYIHIPFCKKACTYCDFHFTTSLKYAEEMTDAICKEIILKKDRLTEQVGSIYFGGGTPSVLPSPYLNKIFDTLTQHFSIAANAEITMETNPDDLSRQKIAELRKMPVNRFSIGTQSFFDEDLRWMNRAHLANEAEDSIKRSQDAGFENLSIDLIYGYPLLTNLKWQENIRKTVELQVPHISGYSLTVEPKTALDNLINKGIQKPMNDDQSAEQFQILMEKTALAGFEHYEISNYSLPGKYAVHNTNYWRGIPYLGIGPSAHGFDGTNRQLNIANNALYLEKLINGKLAETVEELTILDRLNEYIMTSLRTMWGMDLEKIKYTFGKTFHEEMVFNLQPFIERNWLKQHDQQISLTVEGKLFADHIASELFLLDNHER
jgi:oxygen-independent coproporphyrinogen-3 oxidase